MWTKSDLPPFSRCRMTQRGTARHSAVQHVTAWHAQQSLHSVHSTSPTWGASSLSMPSAHSSEHLAWTEPAHPLPAEPLLPLPLPCSAPERPVSPAKRSLCAPAVMKIMGKEHLHTVIFKGYITSASHRYIFKIISRQLVKTLRLQVCSKYPEHTANALHLIQ